jgi:hypothetical protein
MKRYGDFANVAARHHQQQPPPTSRAISWLAVGTYELAFQWS